jgi:hypothetical protein
MRSRAGGSALRPSGDPCERTDFIVGELKGGLDNVNLNVRFRAEPDTIRTVLHRFGAFADAEIDRVCAAVPGILEPRTLQRSASFPELNVPAKQPAYIRHI